jgi:hypothetical protein
MKVEIEICRLSEQEPNQDEESWYGRRSGKTGVHSASIRRMIVGTRKMETTMSAT